MRYFIKHLSIALLIFSFFYIAHIIYFTQNGILVGTYVVETSKHEFEVVKITKSSYGRYLNLKEGDKILQINGHMPSSQNIKKGLSRK
ncbi:histidine kinase, partial [Bacillus amyloliquefaciens]|nr:histidine kinase [Bacillus amyloliquefaciens]